MFGHVIAALVLVFVWRSSLESDLLEKHILLLNTYPRLEILTWNLSIGLLEGNLDDSPSIFRNAKTLTNDPIWGVFGVTTPMGGSEQEQGYVLLVFQLNTYLRVE